MKKCNNMKEMEKIGASEEAAYVIKRLRSKSHTFLLQEHINKLSINALKNPSKSSIDQSSEQNYSAELKDNVPEMDDKSIIFHKSI